MHSKIIQFEKITALVLEDIGKSILSTEQMQSFAQSLSDTLKMGKITAHAISNDPLYRSDDYNPCNVDDYIFACEKGGYIVNFACVFVSLESVKSLDETKGFAFCESLYPQRVRENPLGWRLYAKRLAQKRDSFVLHKLDW